MLLFFSALGLCLPAHAQTTEGELKARLLGKPLYLRGFWREDKLHFDASGQLMGKPKLLSFTLCGVDVSKVQLKNNQLILEARRIGLEFVSNSNSPKRVVLLVNDKDEETMRIVVDQPQDGDFGHALDAIFVEDLTKLVPLLPTYWQRYAHEKLLPDPAPASPDLPAKKVHGVMKAPVVVKGSEPVFSPAARNLHYTGKVLISLHVDENGKPSHLVVAKPAGLGLDEQALYAVQQYLFKPATEDGKPIVVELNIEINFQLY
ncbi:energy transducer TonB [Edaphobacter flagellatus]|uniref:energy transducer TonB n=1 Tax=Edaphobacter flagellatus TaxID=1933044 RepID=UPI0021B2DCCA|nr:energy transducer TonB [Edaphobacter flagellatus]